MHAKANQPVNSAWIEFDPGVARTRRAETLVLKAHENTASGVFYLARLKDGSPQHSAYQVRLTSESGLKNDRPTLHRIEPLPDRVPEIEVLAPLERRVELPVDRTLKVELQGRDPDFGLCKIALELKAGDKTREPVVLLDHNEGQPGPANVSYIVDPKTLGLLPGDDLVVVGVAEDNRHDTEGKPAANTSRTDRYVIHVTPPEIREVKPGEQPMPKESESNNDTPMPNGTKEPSPPNKPATSEKPKKPRG